MYRYFRPLTLLFLVTLLTGCYTTLFVMVESYNYDKDVTFTIDSVQEGRSIATGNGSYNAKSGFKFVMLFVTLKNHSAEKKKLNLEDFYLLEPKSHTKYKLDMVMMQSGVNIWGGTDPKINANDVMLRKLVFTFPKDEKAELFSLNGEQHPIKYTGATATN